MKINNMIREKAETSELYNAIDYTIYNIVEGTPPTEEGFNMTDKAIEEAARDAINLMDAIGEEKTAAGLLEEVLKNKSLIIEAVKEWEEETR